MQISLFKDPSLNRAYNRLAKYMLQRNFSLKDSLDPVLEMDSNTKGYDEFKKRILGICSKTRNYTSMGAICQDSHFELELLAVEEHSRAVTVVIDFSDCLDFMLAYLVDCDQDSIRSIENYTKVSDSIMNCKFLDATDLPLSPLLTCNQRIIRYFDEINRNSTSNNGDERFTMLECIHTFFDTLSYKMYDLESYCAAAVADRFNGVMKSRSFGKIIVSCSKQMNEDLIVTHKMPSGNVLTMSPKIVTFREYEYAQITFGGGNK